MKATCFSVFLWMFTMILFFGLITFEAPQWTITSMSNLCVFLMGYLIISGPTPKGKEILNGIAIVLFSLLGILISAEIIQNLKRLDLL